MSEVPLGSFLSGGADSAAVVATMARLQSSPVDSCTIGFTEENFSETEQARLLARHVGARHHETIISPRATEVVERLAWHYDEPFADSSAVPTYYVSRAARERVSVALSGDGGDENFAGYKRYIYDTEDNRLKSRLPSPLRPLFSALGEIYPALDGAPRLRRGKSFLRRLGQDPLEGYLARITVPAEDGSSLLSADARRELQDYDPLDQFREHYHRAGSDDLLSRIQYLDIKTYLTDDICVKVDRASMAVSLEVRSPLLDHRLMELAATIPSTLKLRGGVGKRIFKKSIEKMLPPGYLDAPKRGFGVPVAEWFRGQLREWASEVLFQPNDLLDTRRLRTIWDRHQEGAQDHSAVLWGVFMFRQWQSTFQARLSNIGASDRSHRINVI
jgi:asparagine synthase (glutamine-hydrolysing)